MKLSGFTFARNAEKMCYPIAESIRSALPIVDEYIVLICDGDKEDRTLELVEGIGSDKIKIHRRPWPEKASPGGHIYGDLTNEALDLCTGDWRLYVQADEAVHEDDHATILARCRELLDDTRVEGLLFEYLHFWGDYRHHLKSHGWYQREVRIVRKGCGLRAKGDAQSFRHPDRRKARVKHSFARMFHYGWVRPPRVMQGKVAATFNYYPKGQVREPSKKPEFDYGPLRRPGLRVFAGTHPEAMQERIRQPDWRDKLRDTDPPGLKRPLHKDEKFKYRFLSAIENMLDIDLNHKNYRRLGG